MYLRTFEIKLWSEFMKENLSIFTHFTNNMRSIINFGLSEKHTKIWKNVPRGFDGFKVSKCQNHEEDFLKFCVLLRKSEL